MRGSGTEISGMAKDLKDTRMEIPTLDSLSTAKRMAREFTPGPTAKFTMANGTKALRKVTVFGKESRTILTLASGILPKLMATESTRGPMGIGTKDSGGCVLSTGWAQTPLRMETNTLENILMESRRVKESTAGHQAKSTWEISKKEWSGAGASGDPARTQPATPTRASTSRTRRTVKVFSRGRVEIPTKESTGRTRGTETAKCCGLMEACMRASGSKASSMDLVEWCSQMAQPRKVTSKTTCSNIWSTEHLWLGPPKRVLASKTTIDPTRTSLIS